MTAITRFYKSQISTQSSPGVDVMEECSAFTVSWSDVTGAGFANGDDVLVICLHNVGGGGVNGIFTGEWRQGSTFAGATAIPGTKWVVEPESAFK